MGWWNCKIQVIVFLDSFFTATKKRKGNPWVLNQSLFNEII